MRLLRPMQAAIWLVRMMAAVHSSELFRSRYCSYAGRLHNFVAMSVCELALKGVYVSWH